MMKKEKYHLTCPVCSTRFSGVDASENIFQCGQCNAPTVVHMNLDPSTRFCDPGDTTLWRYYPLLPLNDRKWIVSQGEGGTPLLHAPRLAAKLGLENLLLKNETLNPTGSFKDRQISVGISKAREHGADTVAVVSSGNVAASAASYASRAGMTCHVFTPFNAPSEKLIQAQMYGAVFYKVNTLSSSMIFRRVESACRDKNWYLLSTAGLYNPFQVEGAKTIAHELFEQTDPLPDWIIVPVGGGGLLGALWRGFEELKRLGSCERTPGLVGVQADACSPLVNAVEKDLSAGEVIANPVAVGETVAGAIADDILFDAYTALPAIRKTGGTAVRVSDEEMLASERLLARHAGIFAEPTSASTVAALIRLRAANFIGSTDKVCCVITGSGFKDMETAGRLVAPPTLVEATEEAFREL